MFKWSCSTRSAIDLGRLFESAPLDQFNGLRLMFLYWQDALNKWNHRPQMGVSGVLWNHLRLDS